VVAVAVAVAVVVAVAVASAFADGHRGHASRGARALAIAVER
jgi:hypothetical protein